MKIKVKIIRAYNDNLAAHCIDESTGHISELFQFDYRKELLAWLFWMTGNYTPQNFSGKEFPEQYFIDACKAKYLILYGKCLPESVEIVSGKELITQKIQP